MPRELTSESPRHSHHCPEQRRVCRVNPENFSLRIHCGLWKPARKVHSGGNGKRRSANVTEAHPCSFEKAERRRAKEMEKADIWLFFLTLSGSTFWKIPLCTAPQPTPSSLPLFLFIIKNETEQLKMGQDLTYQVTRESELECLVFWWGGERRGREMLRLPFLVFLNYENHSRIKNPCFRLLPSGDL